MLVLLALIVSTGVVSAGLVDTSVAKHLPHTRLNFPCVQEMIKCNDDDACIACYDPFTPQFDLSNLDSCEGVERGFEQSYAKNCNTSNANLTRLELCLADDLFYVLTIGTVKNMCSGHVIATA
eukprot:11065-Heterococcus_DN1.PRE.1